MLAGLIIIAVILVVVVFVLILNGAERRIPVQYSKKMVGRKMMGGQTNNIPLKVNTAGVIPIIFASSIMSMPGMIAQFAGKANGTGIGSEILRGLSSSNWCNPSQIWYSWGLVLYIVLCVFFALFSILPLPSIHWKWQTISRNRAALFLESVRENPHQII